MLPGASSASPPPRFPFRLHSSPITVSLPRSPVLFPPSPIATRPTTYFFIDWPTYCIIGTHSPSLSFPHHRHHDHQTHSLRPKGARPWKLYHVQRISGALTHNLMCYVGTETTTRLCWHMPQLAPPVWSPSDRPSRWCGQHPHVVHRPCQILWLSETPVPIKFIFRAVPKLATLHHATPPPACVAVCFYSSSSSPLIAFLASHKRWQFGVVGYRVSPNILRFGKTSHLPKYKLLSMCDTLTALGDVIRSL